MNNYNKLTKEELDNIIQKISFDFEQTRNDPNRTIIVLTKEDLGILDGYAYTIGDSENVREGERAMIISTGSGGALEYANTFLQNFDCKTKEEAIKYVRTYAGIYVHTDFGKQPLGKLFVLKTNDHKLDYDPNL